MHMHMLQLPYQAPLPKLGDAVLGPEVGRDAIEPARRHD
jgi:hypothetical protein